MTEEVRAKTPEHHKPEYLRTALLTGVPMLALLMGALLLFPPLWSSGPPLADTVSLEESMRIVPVDINAAGAEELMTLEGVGQAKAKAIIAYRAQNGPFTDPEQLAEVKGISEKMVAAWLEQAAIVCGEGLP